VKSIGEKCLYLLAASLVALAGNSWSTPAMEGDIAPLKVTLQLPGPDGATAARAQVQRSGSSFIRLRLASIVDGGGGDFRVSLKDADFQERASYRRADLDGQQELWTALIPFDTAVIEVTAVDPANPPRISFVVDQLMYESRGAKVLSISGRDQRRWLIEYKEDTALQKAAASVAKLVFVRDGGGFTCTGFMVSDSLMLTNRHCISTAAECRTAQAIFGFELDEKNRLRAGPQHACQEVVKVGGPELDFALLRLAGAPGRADRSGKLVLKADTHTEGAKLVMVQHPYGEAKQVSRDDCLIKTVAAPSYESSRETDFGHTCDTLNGSSGSPMLNEKMEVIGLHHLGFDLSSRRWGRENRAVSIRFILPLIEASLTAPQ